MSIGVCSYELNSFAANGSKLSTEERSYGMVLADAAGQPAPFFKPCASEDRRLIPGKVTHRVDQAAGRTRASRRYRLRPLFQGREGYAFAHRCGDCA